MKRRTAIKERAEGIKVGKAEGRKERTIEMVRKMHAEGMDDAFIAKVTELSESEIAAIA